MGILSWILLGLIAGALAKLIMPGRNGGGIIVTIVLGIIGAFVGGFVVSLFGYGTVTEFNLGSIVAATIGAILLLALFRAFAGGRRV